MRIKSYISRLIINPILLKFLIFFRPRRFLIRLYSYLLFYDLPKDFVVDAAGGVVDVVAGYGKGLKMILNVGDKANSQNIYYWFGLHELATQRLFVKFVKPGFIVYDIGAYIGFFSLLAARLARPSGRVYAFEPLPDNIERIKLHISLNGMEDTVFCILKAVFDKTDNVPFYDCGRNSWGRIGEAISSTEKYSLVPRAIVETISLDEFVFCKGNPAPDLIKIDVEGREGKVLAGARQLLKKFKPIIICEVHYPEAAKQVYEELSCLGYEFKDTREKKLNNVSSYCGHIIARAK
jgi:FkbM family methyltransferase